jgi:hypothetical protein
LAVALKKAAPLDADEVIVVGDTPYDVEAAAKCGIATIALRSGGFADEVFHKVGAIAIYDHISALLADYAASPCAVMRTALPPFATFALRHGCATTSPWLFLPET